MKRKNKRIIGVIKIKMLSLTPLVILFIKLKYLFKRGTKPIFNKNAVSSEFSNKKGLVNKNIAIFSCYFKDGVIKDSTVYYLKELNKLGFTVILIADSPILKSELTKINDLVKYAKFERHGEYDFGSYKIGYNYLKDNRMIENIDSLLLCNDSVYGPIFNLKETFKNINTSADFWGLIKSNEIRPHLQSWFIVLNKSVVQSKHLGSFLDNVKRQKKQWDVIIKYETKFTKYLTKNGFSYSYYLSCSDSRFKEQAIINRSTNIDLYPKQLIQNYNFPFVKVKFFNGTYDKFEIDSKKETLDLIKTNNSELYEILINELNPKSFD